MSEIPLSPIGREQIHKLEAILLINSIFRPDVLEELKKSEERITWVDSLAVAAAALAREKAKITVSQIADELGRTEATIRNHLQGKTRAGQIVKETYEKISRENVTVTLPEFISAEEIKRLKSELEEEHKRRLEVENILKEIQALLAQMLDRVSKAIA